MTDANLDKTIGKWISTGHPMARHTYDMLSFAANTGELILLAWGGNGMNCTQVSSWTFTPKVAHYNPLTKTWSYSPASALNIGSGGSSEYDPVSGKIVVVRSNGMWIYDPVNKTMSTVQSFSNAGLSYSQNLVYFPPNQKMYYIMNDGHVWEVSLNRSNFADSTIQPVSGITGSLPNTPETGWAYDSVNKVIGGGVHNGVFHAYNPLTKTWSSRTMLTQPAGLSVGTQAFHAINYDPINNVFVFVTNGASGRHTWAYRYGGTAPGSSDTTPPSAPTGLTVAALSFSQVSLSWSGSTDNVGVVSYRIYRNGAQVGSVAGTSYLDTGLTAATTYSYAVAAVDAAGNQSAMSAAVSRTTPEVTDTTAPSVTLTSPVGGSSVSGTTTVQATVADDVGVIGVQFKLNGSNLGAEDTSAPYSVSWNTTQVAGGTCALQAVARDAAGRTATSSSVSVTVSNGAATLPPPTDNSITISDLSGSTQSSRPVSVSRVFRQGDIPQFAQAVVGGTPVLTQVDVKNRWPDGSLKFAVDQFRSSHASGQWVGQGFIHQSRYRQQHRLPERSPNAGQQLRFRRHHRNDRLEYEGCEGPRDVAERALQVLAAGSHRHSSHPGGQNHSSHL